MSENINGWFESKSTGLSSKVAALLSKEGSAGFLQFLRSICDAKGHVQDDMVWHILFEELKKLAEAQVKNRDLKARKDPFQDYATLYDEVIGQPCLDTFMEAYLTFFKANFSVDFQEDRLLSIGCGTGLVEAFLIEKLGFTYEHLLGFDLAPSMIKEAQGRILAQIGDVLQLDPKVDGTWDIAFSGLNVFHYLPFETLEQAVQKTSRVIRPGGYFIGDFISPDHIRWYPNVLYSSDERTISLRQPRLVESAGKMFQESEIFNLRILKEEILVDYAGKHLRHLAPMHRVRHYFERHFGGAVKIYDAFSLEECPADADTTPSTRYVLIAQKA